jgi:hypothetical protein
MPTERPPEKWVCCFCGESSVSEDELYVVLYEQRVIDSGEETRRASSSVRTRSV